MADEREIVGMDDILAEVSIEHWVQRLNINDDDDDMLHPTDDDILDWDEADFLIDTGDEDDSDIRYTFIMTMSETDLQHIEDNKEIDKIYNMYLSYMYQEDEIELYEYFYQKLISWGHIKSPFDSYEAICKNIEEHNFSCVVAKRAPCHLSLRHALKCEWLTQKAKRLPIIQPYEQLEDLKEFAVLVDDGDEGLPLHLISVLSICPLHIFLANTDNIQVAWMQTRPTTVNETIESCTAPLHYMMEMDNIFAQMALLLVWIKFLQQTYGYYIDFVTTFDFFRKRLKWKRTSIIVICGAIFLVMRIETTTELLGPYTKAVDVISIWNQYHTKDEDLIKK